MHLLSFRPAPGHWLLLFLLLAWSAAFAGTLATVWTEWLGTGAYSHGLLGPLVAGFFVWQQRREFSHCRPRPSIAAVAMALVLASGWWLAGLIDILLVQQLAALLLLFVLIFALFPAALWRRLWLPAVLLLLVWPIWNLLQLPLREVATEVSYRVLRGLGGPILLDGYRLTVPGGDFIVEKACSGLGFLLIGLFVGCCFIRANRLSGWLSVGFLLFAAGLAVFSNWVRIVVIVLVGDATRMQHFIVTDHLSFGWAVYVVTLIPLIWGGKRFFAPKAGVPSSPPQVRQSANRGHWPAAVTAACLLALVPLAERLVDAAVDPNYGYLPPQPGNARVQWLGEGTSAQWLPTFHGAGSEYFGRYRSEGRQLSLYIANYPRQSQGQELVYIKNRLFDQRRWQLRASRDVRIPSAEGGFEMRLLSLEGGQQRRRLIGYWYEIGGRLTTSPALAKIYQLLATFSGRPGASVVAVALDTPAVDELGAAALSQFAGRLQPML